MKILSTILLFTVSFNVFSAPLAKPDDVYQLNLSSDIMSRAKTFRVTKIKGNIIYFSYNDLYKINGKEEVTDEFWQMDCKKKVFRDEDKQDGNDTEWMKIGDNSNATEVYKAACLNEKSAAVRY